MCCAQQRQQQQQADDDGGMYGVRTQTTRVFPLLCMLPSSSITSSSSIRAPLFNLPMCDDVRLACCVPHPCMRLFVCSLPTAHIQIDADTSTADSSSVVESYILLFRPNVQWESSRAQREAQASKLRQAGVQQHSTVSMSLFYRFVVVVPAKRGHEGVALSPTTRS